jgi:hypothetical protein
MCNYFRTLRADEIEVRVQQVKKSTNGKVYAQMLLYKDARVDMMLLDEMFGIFGWQREHTFKDGKNYCRVSVYDEKRNVWVVKEDVGIPSNTEAEKGQASDAFKRACVNLGIGRELYTSPRIVVELANGEYYESQDAKGNKVQRLSTKVHFSVKAIDYDEKRSIVALEIVDNSGRTRAKIGVIHEALFTAKAEANNARTLTEAHNVWKKYPEFHDDPGFRVACKAKADSFADELLSKTQQTA